MSLLCVTEVIFYMHKFKGTLTVCVIRSLSTFRITACKYYGCLTFVGLNFKEKSFNYERNEIGEIKDVLHTLLIRFF